jgi:threonine dehydrogenase-like Zn-dependent dehydrogenase
MLSRAASLRPHTLRKSFAVVSSSSHRTHATATAAADNSGPFVCGAGFDSRADVVVCGAGFSGIATAYHLSKMGVKGIIIVDERPPMTFTSAYSSECCK